MERLTPIACFMIIFVGLMLVVFGCDPGGVITSPSQTPTGNAAQLNQVDPTLPAAEAENTEDENEEIQECEIVGLNRSEIKKRVDGARVYLTVPIDPQVGAPHFKLPGYSGEKKYRANVEVFIGTFKPGDYRYKLFAETVAEGKLYQCDVHWVKWTIIKKNEECIPKPKPKCPYGAPIYNAVDCTWTCPPCGPDTVEPPVCKLPTPDLGSFNPERCAWPCVCDKAKHEEPECEYGRAKWLGDRCVWKCPTCEQVNTKTNKNGSGTSNVAKTGIISKRVTVSASYSIDGASFTGQAGILWRKGGSKYVKKKAPVSIKCGGKKSGTLSWDSKSSSHTSCSASYSLIFFTNNSSSNPNILKEVPLNKTGLCK